MIKILVDSSADILENSHKNLEIIPIPLTHKGNSITNIKLDEFYMLLENTDVLPKTSQINPETYIEYFKKYKDNEIICLTLSSKLSGTFSSANLAKQLLADECDVSNIYIIDSECATIQFTLLTKLVLKDLDNGESVKKILENIEKNKKNIKVRAIIDDLEFLYKGGRLSRASAIVGSTLNIKPILEIKEGEIRVATKVRGFKKANKTILDEMNTDKPKYIITGYTTKSDSYEEFKNQIDLPYEEIQIGPIIGTHVGPKCYAIVYI